MGDKLRTGQRTARRRGRERAAAELSRPDLINRADVVSVEYPVKPAGGACLSAGETLAVYAGDQPDRVVFLRGTQAVGYSTGEAAARLRQAMVESGQEAIEVRILRVSSIGVGTARIVRKDGDEQTRKAAP